MKYVVQDEYLMSLSRMQWNIYVSLLCHFAQAVHSAAVCSTKVLINSCRQTVKGGVMETELVCLNLFSSSLFVCLYSSPEGDEVGPGITDDTEDENSANQIAGKIPNFCVLLHGSLKVEGMVALVQLGYGAGCLPEKSLSLLI